MKLTDRKRELIRKIHGNRAGHNWLTWSELYDILEILGGEDGEWIRKNDPLNTLYQKRDYTLTITHRRDVILRNNQSKIICSMNFSCMTDAEAQAWADAEIAKMEANTCDDPMCHCHKAATEKPTPKPFGPGSRLKALNGDVWQVFKDSSDSTYCVLNMTQGLVVRIITAFGNRDLEKIKKALIATGAMILED